METLFGLGMMAGPFVGMTQNINEEMHDDKWPVQSRDPFNIIMLLLSVIQFTKYFLNYYY